MKLFNGIQKSGLELIIGSGIQRSQLMCNLLGTSQQYSKHQTRAEEIEKFLDKGLDSLYHCSVINSR